MRPEAITLRCFRGVRSATGKDEKTIVFSDLPLGLIAFVGENGTAKTTFLDNCHPYRIMPSKINADSAKGAAAYSPTAFSYYGETYGSNAAKELFWTPDGVTHYRSLILIDAERRKQQAYLYRLEDGREMAVNEGGGTDSYDEAVAEILGSPMLFFTSRFRAQDARRISDYTRGNVKEIFAELFCAEDYKTRAENARAVKDALGAELERLLIEKRRLQGVAAKEETQRTVVMELARKIGVLERELLELEATSEKTKMELNDLEVTIRLIQESMVRKARLEESLGTKETRAAEAARTITEKRDSYNTKYKALRAKIKAGEELLRRAPALRSRVGEEAKKAKEVETLRSQIGQLDTEVKILADKLQEIAGFETTVKSLEGELGKLRLKRKHGMETAEKALRGAEERAEMLKRAPCEGMDIAAKCPFISDAAKNAVESLSRLRTELETTQRSNPREAEIEGEIKRISSKTLLKERTQEAGNDASRKRKEAAEKLEAAEKELEALREELKALGEVEATEKLVPEHRTEVEALVAEARQVVAQMEREKKIVEEEAEALKQELAKITVDTTAETRKKELSHGLEKLKIKETEKRSSGDKLRRELGAAEEIARQVEEAKAGLAAIAGKEEVLNEWISRWTLLEKAMGNDGLIALEIDDSGQEISAITNDLLYHSFGPRFTVTIRTQDGTKEVFEIVVFDAERNEKKSLKEMSPGERTWIEEAITKAIGLYNAQRNGKRCLTLFTDEKDGALDPKKKKEFVLMKRRVIQLGNYEREFFISHTTEVQQMADAVIQFG